MLEQHTKEDASVRGNFGTHLCVLSRLATLTINGELACRLLWEDLFEVRLSLQIHKITNEAAPFRDPGTVN